MFSESRSRSTCGKFSKLRPVTLLACEAGGNEAIAFHCGLDRILHAVKNRIDELPRTSHLAFHPTGGAWAHVTVNAKNVGMG